MSDLTERLRSVQQLGYRTDIGRTCKQAADEIDRLTAALAEARDNALEEAAKALDAWGDIYGDNAAKTVRSLKGKP